MDFAEKDVDAFGEEYDDAEAEAEGGGGASSGSSSPSSATASSSSSSAASSGRSNSPVAGGRDGEGREYDSFDVVPVKPAVGDEEEEEVRDLFGYDNEEYVSTELVARFSWAKLSPRYLVNRIS